MNRRLNNKGYMLIEIILAFVIAMGIAYFMFELIIKIKNKNDDLLVKTLVATDQAIIYNTIMNDIYKNGPDSFSCDKLKIKDKILYYDNNNNNNPENDELINITSNYSNIGTVDCKKKYNSENNSISIKIPMKIEQLNEAFDVEINYEYDSNKYTISYNTCGGSNAPNTQTKIHGIDLVLSSIKPTRSGYTFQGWSNASSCSNATSKNYDAGSEYMENSSATLYAIWEPNVVTVKFDTNGGKITSSTTYNGVTYGWTTNSAGVISRTKDSTTTNSFFKVSYDSKKDLPNADGGYMTISNGYSVITGAEWKCLSNNCVRDTYNDTTEYSASEYCDLSSGNCTIILGANWSATCYQVSSNQEPKVGIACMTKVGSNDYCKDIDAIPNDYYIRVVDDSNPSWYHVTWYKKPTNYVGIPIDCWCYAGDGDKIKTVKLVDQIGSRCPGDN